MGCLPAPSLLTRLPLCFDGVQAPQVHSHCLGPGTAVGRAVLLQGRGPGRVICHVLQWGQALGSPARQLHAVYYSLQGTHTPTLTHLKPPTHHSPPAELPPPPWRPGPWRTGRACGTGPWRGCCAPWAARLQCAQAGGGFGLGLGGGEGHAVRVHGANVAPRGQHA